MEKNFYFLLRKNLDQLIGNALKEQIFSACSLGFYKSKAGKTSREILNYGKTGVGNNTNEVDDNSFFDLASLTKALVTAVVILYLVDKGILKNDDKLSDFFKNINPDKQEIRIIHLLTHTSGLPAHKPYFIELVKKPFDLRWNYVLQNILSEKLLNYPGKVCVYSDLGFILLGCIIERVTGEKLDIFWKKNILIPLKIQNSLKFPDKNHLEIDIFVETGLCTWSKTKLEGLVNDDNCRALGGISGHAGLFGTISGLLEYVEKISLEIKGETRILQFKEETLKDFTEIKGKRSWINGFDTPDAVCSSSGNYFSDRSFGHLGFTGTSFWMDLLFDCGIVLLTNRVIFGQELKSIKKTRQLIHNLIMCYLKKNYF